jgi:hypothetical protein
MQGVNVDRNRWLKRVLAGVACSLLTGGLFAAELPAALQGCWESDQREVRVIEVWLPPSKNQMLGFSETRIGDKTHSWEFMRIEKTDSGLVFHAMPAGQAAASFDLRSDEDGLLIFENPEHDFPQAVIYRLPTGDQLEARIEGVLRGELQVIPFDKQRFDCSGLWQSSPD